MTKQQEARGSQAIHPPWRTGQYVTYVLERDDGSWVAFALHIIGQSDAGEWGIEATFKTPGGECAVLFRSDPDRAAGAPDLIPVQQKVLRHSHDGADDPLMATALAMNLLMVRSWPAAADSLLEEARPVNYPCGIDRAHLLVTPGPGYDKHHDLCPRVMVTGVAGMTIDGVRNPITVTSFGLNDPAVEKLTSYDDFVDLSHPRSVDHDGFALTYPATWFLQQEPDEEADGVRATAYSAVVGGVSCSLSCSVMIYRGNRRDITRLRTSTRERLSGTLPGLSPRKADPMQLPGDSWALAFHLVQPAIDGVAYVAGYGASGGERFAQLNLSGCIPRASPRRDETLAVYDRVFRAILESFGFL